MEVIGYFLLGLISVVALKAFGKSANPFSQGYESSTGALIVDSSQLTAPVGRMPATQLQDGAYYCPVPTTLYKDSVDGKYYCYNNADFQGTFQIPTPVDMQPAFTGAAPQPTIEQLTGDPYGNSHSMIAPVPVPDVVQGDSTNDGTGTIPDGGYLV